MKKIAAFLLISVFLLSGCSKTTSNVSENQPTSSISAASISEAGSVAVETDKGLLNVDVTLSKTFVDLVEQFGEPMSTELTPEDIENGIKSIVKNEDGSYTFTMSKSAHKAMLEEMALSIQGTIDETVNEDNSIQEITNNKEFTKFKVLVNREEYENGFDQFAFWGIFLSASFYQEFLGTSEYTAEFEVVDFSTNEVIETLNYPQ